MEEKQEKMSHIAMFPWLAFGHLNAFLQLANKLAKRGHTISFFLPSKTQPKLASHNPHPHLLTFISITIPAISGLPAGAETTADVPQSALPLLMAAMDLTQPVLDSSLAHLRPDYILFDVAHWIPGLARKHRIRPIFYVSTFVASFAYLGPWARSIPDGTCLTEAELGQAPPGFPNSSSFKLRAHEVREVAAGARMVVGLDGLCLLEKVLMGIRDCDAVCLKSCREMEGQHGDYLEKQYGKPVIWAGLAVVEPQLPDTVLDEELDGWLKGFAVGSVVYCAFGSERVLEADRFQELVLGLELTGLPFLTALKPPIGHEVIETALPQGFLERTRRGIVQNGWVQQQLILKHPRVGCFVTHCGAGSLCEALVNNCQIVLLPQGGDQFFNAMLMSRVLKVGVQVERVEDDGFFTREAVCDTVLAAMEGASVVGKEVRDNHTRWRELLLKDGFQESYVSDFIRNLRDMSG